MLTRQQLSQIYRPVGPKPIQLGIPFTPATGGTYQLAQAVDLSLPLVGLRLVIKGRDVIGGANMTSVNPEGYLNCIQNIRLTGNNSRQGGNVTLFDIDLATLFTMQHLFGLRKAQFSLSTGGGAITESAVPSTPFPATYGLVAQATYDFRIVVDLPFYPFGSPDGVKPGFLMRQEEWKDSVTVALTFGTQANGTTGFMGVDAGGTTHVYTAYGVGTGTPTVDVYGLPTILGLDLKDKVVPGFCTRVQQPINTILQAAGTGVTLLNLQKQPTSRVIVKIGTGTVAPYFATLSDVNATTLGITLGGNRQVRNRVDIWSHKQSAVHAYERDPIQGYNLLDFLQSGNPDSSYPGDKIGDGSTFQLVSDVTGVANAYGIIVQEQILYRNEGPLYSF